MFGAGKYRIDGEIVNTETGRAIPAEEPLFIIRAQDKLAPAAIRAYARLLREKRLTKAALAIGKYAKEVEAWQKAHKDRVKLPD
ncbi:MAG: hypothetical protein ACK4Z6_02335 [Candidatus Methylomirabilales bacterium]